MAQQPPRRGGNDTGEWKSLYDDPEPNPAPRRSLSSSALSSSGDATLMLDASFAALGGEMLEEDTDPGRGAAPVVASQFDVSDSTTDETDIPLDDYGEASLVTDPYAAPAYSHVAAPSLHAASTQILTPEMVRGLQLPTGSAARL